MSIIMIKNKRIAFPALAEPKGIGEGSPAYGTRFIIDPNDPDVAAIDKAMKDVAIAKWKEDGESILDLLISNKKVAFQHAPYRSTATGKVYAGFEGMFNLGTRSEKTKPTAVDQFGKELVSKSDIERVLYSGCFTHAKVEFWAQDNQYGRRINASLLGIMFAGDGESFGGGSAPAPVSDFTEMAKSAEAEDYL